MNLSCKGKAIYEANFNYGLLAVLQALRQKYSIDVTEEYYSSTVIWVGSRLYR